MFNVPARASILRRAHPGLAAAALSSVLLLSACSGGDSHTAEKAAAPAVPVLVARVQQKTMPVQLRGIGNVEPYVTVAVKARVDGEIVKVFFKGGEEVRKGQRLFQLDPRPLHALLKQSEATLLRDKAQLARAHAQAARYRDLLRQHFVSPDAYAQYRTNVDTAQATVEADEAAVENARLQLEYTTIRSPIDGRTGKVMIQIGNLVKANDTNPLVVINQVKPVYVDFAVPQRYLDRIRSRMHEARLPVQVLQGDGGATVARGELVFIDNTVDVGTGTVHLRGRFANRDERLWPGQFVTAVLTLEEQKDAIVVPSQAVQTGPNGQYVFVVASDSRAEVRKVVVERTAGAETVIARGLTPGERVVTTGQVRLRSGTKVVVSTEVAES